MIENVSVSAEAAPGRVRCPKRLIWVVAVFTGVALSFGASAAQTLNNDGPTSVTATPEDPCLLNHTCGEETPGAVEELQAYCVELQDQSLPLPEDCEQFID
jgi:hypothetical protein